MEVLNSIRLSIFEDQWWDESQDPALAEHVSGSPGWLLSIIFGYLVLVIGIGPAFMRNRKPYDISGLIKFYNVANIALNIGMVVMGLRFTNFGSTSFTCSRDGDIVDRYMVFIGYLALKVSLRPWSTCGRLCRLVYIE